MDMSTNYSHLMQLNAATDSRKIKVRITRRWSPKFPKTNQVICLNMLLVDEQGEAMHAIVRKKEMPKFNLQLKEGMVCELEKFKVEKVTGTHRIVENECCIVFREDTTVTELQGNHENFILHKFCFVDFKLLPIRLNNDTYLSDVIGKLCEMSRIEEFQRKDGTKASKRDMKIENDRGEKVCVTLWGDQALEIEDNMLGNKRKVVLVITSTTVKEYGGVSNLWSSSATKIYINLDMPEFARMLESFVGEDESVIQVLEAPVNKQPFVEEQMQMNRRTLREILADLMDLSNVGRKYTCKVRVVRVFDEWWSYLSCPKTTCKRRVRKQKFDSSYYCDTCKMDVRIPLPRYKARMKVEDYSGPAIVTVFDKDAETLIKHPCGELCEIAEKPDGREKIAGIFENVVGNESIFQIRLSEYDMYSGNNVLTTSKVFPIVHWAGTSNFMKGKEKEMHSFENISTVEDAEGKDETEDLHRSKRICLNVDLKE